MVFYITYREHQIYQQIITYPMFHEFILIVILFSFFSPSPIYIIYIYIRIKQFSFTPSEFKAAQLWEAGSSKLKMKKRRGTLES